MKIDNYIYFISLFFYLVGLISYGIYLVLNREPFARGLVFALGFAFSLHTAITGLQAVHLIQTASMNVFDVLVLFSWALVALALLLQSRLRMRILMGFILLIVIVLGGVALGLPNYFSKPVPTLNAFWFSAHILMCLLGYAAFFVALISGCLYLVLDRQLKHKISSPLFYRLPPLESLERMIFRSIWAGAILLAMGLTSGIVWARSSGISLSVTDPKVIASWATLGIYMLIIYIRSTARWRGRKVAYLTVLGFTGVVITFFIMNFISQGHGFF